MARTKGTKNYPESIKTRIAKEYRDGETISGLNRKYGISRYAIHSWCGLGKTKEEHIPKHRGRPRTKPARTISELEKENKQLKMEVELLRSFLQAAGRR